MINTQQVQYRKEKVIKVIRPEQLDSTSELTDYLRSLKKRYADLSDWTIDDIISHATKTCAKMNDKIIQYVQYN